MAFGNDWKIGSKVGLILHKVGLLLLIDLQGFVTTKSELAATKWYQELISTDN